MCDQGMCIDMCEKKGEGMQVDRRRGEKEEESSIS